MYLLYHFDIVHMSIEWWWSWFVLVLLRFTPEILMVGQKSRFVMVVVQNHNLAAK